MSRTAKLAVILSALVVAGLVAVAAPAVASVASEVGGWALFNEAEPVAEDEPVVEDEEAAEIEPSDPLQEAAWAIGCDDFAAVGGYAGAPRPSPRPDMGARELAAGSVTLGTDGEVQTYTVAPGDAGAAIGERFCVDYVTLLVANDTFPTIHPGDVLRINP